MSGTFKEESYLDMGVKISATLACIFVVIYIVVLLTGEHKEKYTIARGQYYKPGQAIFGDFPEKVKIGDSEYENPIYKDISTRWEPTSNKANGYTIWKMRD